MEKNKNMNSALTDSIQQIEAMIDSTFGVKITATKRFSRKKAFIWKEITLEPQKITKTNLGNGWERTETISSERFKREYFAKY